MLQAFSFWLSAFALGMAAAERFGLARRLHCAVAGSARLNGKIAALRFYVAVQAGRDFIPQQPDPGGGHFCGSVEPGNAQGMLDSRLRGNDKQGRGNDLQGHGNDKEKGRGNARSS